MTLARCVAPNSPTKIGAKDSLKPQLFFLLVHIDGDIPILNIFSVRQSCKHEPDERQHKSDGQWFTDGGGPARAASGDLKDNVCSLVELL
jgi:hypothetical protein